MREVEFRVPLYESSCGGICKDFRDYSTTIPNTLKIFLKILLISFLLYPPGPISAPLSYNVRRKFVLIRKWANHVMIYVNEFHVIEGLKKKNIKRKNKPFVEKQLPSFHFNARQKEKSA